MSLAGGKCVGFTYDGSYGYLKTAVLPRSYRAGWTLYMA